MTAAGNDTFAHGTYADYSGVVFSGPGLSEERLAVSDRFIDPLFRAILDRAGQGHGADVPKVVAEWNEGRGWADACGVHELSPAEATEFLVALSAVSGADVRPHAAGATPEECVRCARVIEGFLRHRVDRGLPVYIEAD